MTAVKNIIRRITLFYFLTVLLSLLVTAQIIYLQFFTELKTRAEVIKTKPVEASRGNIYAHDMRLLATSIPKYEIRVDFYAMKTNIIENDACKMSLYYDKLKKDLKNEIAKLKPAERKIKKEEIKKRREELENRIKEHRRSDTVNANIYINNEIKKLADSLSNLFRNKTAAEYESFIKTCCRKSIKKKNDTTEETYRYVRIGRRNINYIELKKLLGFPIFEQGKGLCGLIDIEKTERIPFYGSLGLATIGYVNSNGFPLMGIERSFDEYLKGKDGLQAVIGERPINNQKNTLPEQGYDIVSALDINIQESVDKALMRQITLGNERGINIEGGTAVVMEVKSGEIRAMANLKLDDKGNYTESYNYALRERSDPGSTFKLASLIALLDDEFVNLNDMVDVKANTYMEAGNLVWLYKGFKVRDSHIFGDISVKKVFANSSNIGTAKLVTKYYGQNPQKYFDKLHSIGLFQESLNLQVEGEYKSFAEMEVDTLKPNPNLLAPSSYGYYVKFAPIHTLTFYNAVANNGKMMKPKFVKKILRHGQVVKSYSDEVLKDRICSEETLQKAREALQGVADSGTTVRQFKNSAFKIAGKTGTAQRVIDGKYKDKSSGNAYQATFVGYVPAHEPKYSIIVVLYSPKIRGDFYGSTYAAPVIREIAEKLYSTDVNWHKPVERNDDSLHLPNVKTTVAQRIKIIASKLDIPVDNDAKNSELVKISKNNSKLTTAKIQIDDNKVPSVMNMGLRDAVYLLEKLGLRVVFSGKGKVKKQSIAEGTAITKGSTIYLELET